MWRRIFDRSSGAPFRPPIKWCLNDAISLETLMSSCFIVSVNGLWCSSQTTDVSSHVTLWLQAIADTTVDSLYLNIYSYGKWSIYFGKLPCHVTQRGPTTAELGNDADQNGHSSSRREGFISTFIFFQLKIDLICNSSTSDDSLILTVCQTK